MVSKSDAAIGPQITDPNEATKALTHCKVPVVVHR